MYKKYQRCWCKPASDWDEDPIDVTQKDNNAKNSYMDNWSDHERFWEGKNYEQSKSSQKPKRKFWPPPKHDSEESDCNENLYPHCYRAKVQSQVTPTQPPPSCPKCIRKNNPSNNNKRKNIPDKMSENERKDSKSIGTSLEPGDKTQEIRILGTKTIAKEIFDTIN